MRQTRCSIKQRVKTFQRNIEIWPNLAVPGSESISVRYGGSDQYEFSRAIIIPDILR